MQRNTRILVITNDVNDPHALNSTLFADGGGKDISVARSYLGALEMARKLQPQLVIVRDNMVMLQGQYFPDVLKQACPSSDIFIVDESDLPRAATIA